MAQATVREVSAANAAAQVVDCAKCLTRDCAMAGVAASPVQVCNTYRQANCYMCNKADCALNGTLNSPVMACEQFEAVAIA